MAIEQDYLLRQIKGVAKVIGQILFHRESFDYVLPENGNYSEFDNLFLKLNSMLENNEINEAENLLFEHIDGKNPVYLQIALSFYETLAKKPEKVLTENNFSKAEIEQGFLDVLELYNIKVERKK